MSEVRSSHTERVLATGIARRFYVEGASKSDIADEIGISRFRVARILEKALRDGLVRIEFAHPPGAVDYDLSAALQLRFHLANAVVVDDEGSGEEQILDDLGRVAAELMSELAGPDEVLGFAWTRAMEAMTAYLEPLQARAVVQLGGAWPGAGMGRTTIDLVRDLARLSSGRAYAFYAPLLASDAAAAAAIRRQPDVLAAKSMYGDVTAAVVGLGAWAEGDSSLWPVFSPAERAAIAAEGVVGEVCGATFAADGALVETALSRQSIGITGEELKACRNVIAVVFGESKVGAIRSALAGGLVKSLVTHARVARLLRDG